MELDLSDCDTSWDSLSLGEIDEYGKTIEDLLSIEPSSEKKKEIPKDDSSTESCSKEKENNSQEQPMEVEVTSIPSSSSAGTSGSTVTVTGSNVKGLDIQKNLVAAKSLKASLIEDKAAFRNAKFATPIREIKVDNCSQQKPQQLSSHMKNKEGRTKIESITFDIEDNNKSTPKPTPKPAPKPAPKLKLTPKLTQQQLRRKKRSVKTTSDHSLVIDVDASVASVPDEGSPFDGSYQQRRKSPKNNDDNSFSAINSMDETYDMMKMYAPEEDCVSIYSKIKPPDRPHFSQPSAASHSNNPNDQNTIQLVTMLMECKQPARARMGAEVYCEFLSTNNNSCHFSEGFVQLTRTLLEQLLEFSDFVNIERILRLTISAQLRVGESVCAKLLEGMHQNHSSVAAIDILNQMSVKNLFNTAAAKKLRMKWITLKTPQKQPRSFICNGSALKMQVNAMDDSAPLDMNASDSLYEDMDVEDTRTPSQNQFPFSSEDSTDNFTSAIESGDWERTGRSFANLVWKLGDDINNKSLLSHLVEMLIVNHTYDPSEFIAFDIAARMANRKSAGVKTDRLVAQCLSRIAVTLVYLAVPGYAYHVVTYLIKKNVNCLDAIHVMEEETTEGLPPQYIRNLIKFIRVAQCNSDFVLAKQLLRDYFKKERLGHKRTPRGLPMVNHNNFHPEIIELLCDLSTHCSELCDIDEAITFLRILPTSCKGETVVDTMNELLRTLLLNREIFGENFNVGWSGEVATMLLARNEITLIRRTLSSGHLNAEKSELFNFLERHRLYCAPRIALRPHLIIMPHTMSLTEMTLSIYRHLTELVEFLMGIGENLNQTLPLRVVLLRKCGPFLPLDPTVLPEEAYFASEERLVETVFKLLKPPLRVLGRKMVNNTHPHHLYETMFNIDMRSVRVWFFENTKYKENIKKSCNGLLAAPCLPPLSPHQLHPPINPEIMKIEPTFMHAAVLAQNAAKLKIEKPAKRFITNKIANVLESLMKKPGNQ